VATDEDPAARIRTRSSTRRPRCGRTLRHDGPGPVAHPRPAGGGFAAFERARPGDIVLLAGKGHEQSIIGPDGPIPYDERAAAETALAALGYGIDAAGPGGG
jgi:hypothetical protein